MTVRTAKEADMEFLSAFDAHIGQEELKFAVQRGRVLIAEEEGAAPVGWLRWNLFWDNTPFMNLLFLREEYRRKGYGTALVAHWEALMRENGCRLVMTSSQADETAQHFYRKLNYTDAGALLLPGQPLEIIFVKDISEDLPGSSSMFGSQRICKNQEYF